MDGTPYRGRYRSRRKACVLGRGGSIALVLILGMMLTGCQAPDPPRGLDPVLPSVSPYTPEPLAKCDYPKRVRFPKWIPEDLPFPRGTYSRELLGPAEGYRRALLVIPVTLEELTHHVLNVWPRNGWVLGRGDSEIGEIEDQFSKPPAFGAFRAQAVICDPGYSLMYLIFTKDRTLPGPVINPSPRGSPLIPSPTPTP